MKKKQAKLYIPVLLENKAEGKEDYAESKATLLNASKIPLLRDILPDEETLITHVQIQRVKFQKDDKYRPKPFEIQLEKSKFNEIINEVKKKHSGASGTHIALFTQYPGVPVCIITELRVK